MEHMSKSKGIWGEVGKVVAAVDKKLKQKGSELEEQTYGEHEHEHEYRITPAPTLRRNIMADSQRRVEGGGNVLESKSPTERSGREQLEENCTKMAAPEKF